MATVKVTKSPNVDTFKASIDGSELAFDSKGEASADVDPGHHHLDWLVLLAPNAAYSIKITAPPSAAWTGGPYATDDQGHGDGDHIFNI
jgi:hypothetical protein